MNQDSSTAAATAMWLGLAVLLVVLAGAILIGWVSRRARQIRRRRPPVPTVMRDIWFLNPPPKRKRDDS